MVPDGALRSENRIALLGVYAALDSSGRRAKALGELGVEFDGPLIDGLPDPVDQLRKASAGDLDRQDYYPIPRLYLARALMDVLGRPNVLLADGDVDQFRPVVEQLVDLNFGGPAPAPNPDRVFDLFVRASRAARFEDRWALLNVARENSPFHPDLRVIEKPQIGTSLHSVGDEIATRVETNFVLRLEGGESPDLQANAPALLPHNWPVCGDFFCELSRAADRDSEAGATGGELSIDTPHWSGVYLERVGGCPNGWFPDTFLRFAWDRHPDQLILRYKLPPRRDDDRTVLSIDEGYIQVNRLHHGYEVSTLKYLLFDDRFISGGGQIIAALAPQFGWLDYSINQFGLCAVNNLPPPTTSRTPSAEGPPLERIDADLQRILDLAKTQLQESATNVDAQFGRVVSKVRDGKYGLNDFVGDWGEAAVRAMRDTSRVALNGINFAEESLRLATFFARKRGNRS